MDVEILKIVGQVAGIGGLGIGLVIIIFKDLLSKTIFPSLTKIQAFRLLMIIVFASWSIALVGIGAWVYVTYITTPSDTETDNKLGNKIEVKTKIISDADTVYIVKNNKSNDIYMFEDYPLILKISNLTKYKMVIDDIFLSLNKSGFYRKYNPSEWSTATVYDGGAEEPYEMMSLNIDNIESFKRVNLLSFKSEILPSKYRKIIYTIPPHETEFIPFEINIENGEGFFKGNENFAIVKIGLDIHYTVNGQENTFKKTNNPSMLFSKEKITNTSEPFDSNLLQKDNFYSEHDKRLQESSPENF